MKEPKGRKPRAKKELKYLGKYLRAHREKAGQNNVKRYLDSRKMGVSPTFYRAVENRQKLPSPESLDLLVVGLDLDRDEAFEQYLHDLLPEDLFRRLVKPFTPEAGVGSARDVVAAQRETIETYRRVFEKGSGDIIDDILLATSDMVSYLNANVHLLPLIHAIYLHERDLTEHDLREVCRQNDIADDLGEILGQFERLGIAQLRRRRVRGQLELVVRRLHRTFRLPQTEGGSRLKDLFVEIETRTALTIARSPSLSATETFVHSGISAYLEDRLPRVQGRLFDFLAELNAATSNDAKMGGTPFFVSVIVSPRSQYDVNQSNDSKDVKRKVETDKA